MFLCLYWLFYVHDQFECYSYSCIQIKQKIHLYDVPLSLVHTFGITTILVVKNVLIDVQVITNVMLWCFNKQSSRFFFVGGWLGENLTIRSALIFFKIICSAINYHEYVEKKFFVYFSFGLNVMVYPFTKPFFFFYEIYEV